MPAKLLHTLSDENSELHKQIGCINGIFQIFDRHRFINKCRNVSHGHKKLTRGQAKNNGQEARDGFQEITEQTKKKAVKDKQTASTESSRTSVSSLSCSSSFSSADYNRNEPSFFRQTIFHETHARELPNASSQWSSSSPDLRDFVKSSIHREARGLVVKTTTKHQAGQQTLKYVDSPRHSAQTKLTNIGVSLLHEPLRCSQLKDGHVDSPRLSYDGRERRQRLGSNIKLRERPRLSLDSKEKTLRSSRVSFGQNDFPEGFYREEWNANLLNRQPEPESHGRTSSVVAKLMGLDVNPAVISVEHNQSTLIKPSAAMEHDSFLRSSGITSENKRNHLNDSPSHSHTETASVQPSNADFVMKLTTTSEFLFEPAPEEQVIESKDHRSALKAQMKALNPPPSVCGEIDKRVAQLEFEKYGKGPRALKQILDAMEKIQQTLEYGKHHSSDSAWWGRDNLHLFQRTNSTVSNTTTVINSPKNKKSPIVIVKPTRLDEQVRNSPSRLITNNNLPGLPRIQTCNLRKGRRDKGEKHTGKDLTPKPNHSKRPASPLLHSIETNTGAGQLRSTQRWKRTNPNVAEMSKSGNRQTDMNFRLQQKRLTLDKQSLSTSSLKSNETQQQPNRQQTESSSPGRKPRSKIEILPRQDIFDARGDDKDPSQHEDSDLLQSEQNKNFSTNNDSDNPHKYRHDEISDASGHQTPNQKNPPPGSGEERARADTFKLAMEQPSPVSVLDAAFYRDESPSPVKKLPSNAFKDEEPLGCEADWIKDNIDNFSSFSKPSLSSKRDQNLANAVPTHEELLIDDAAFSYDRNNADHKYISEILLAASLLRDQAFNSITLRLYQTGLPLNPSIPFALGKRQTSTEAPHKKLRRKLVFDTVNEILGNKLALEGCPKHSIKSSTLTNKFPRQQALLQALCSEIDRLQAINLGNSLEDRGNSLANILQEDLMQQATGSADFQGEFSGIVLDVERLIFKDLINEMVYSELAVIRERSSRICRLPFSK